MLLKVMVYIVKKEKKTYSSHHLMPKLSPEVAHALHFGYATEQWWPVLDFMSVSHPQTPGDVRAMSRWYLWI